MAFERAAGPSCLTRGVALKRRERSRSSLNSDVPAAVSLPALVFVEMIDVAGVMIGIDPHKRSHPAVALDGREKRLGQVRVRASVKQVDGLLEWAGGWPGRSWAIEGARGLGHLLAQQLLASGERVLDVPPKLAARVRLLDTGQINKTDDNDARSVAIAALRGHDVTELSVEDQTVVMRVWARRYHDLGRLRTQAVCRLHTVLGELVPGGVRRDLQASQALAALDRIEAETPIVQAKVELAREPVTDLQLLPERYDLGAPAIVVRVVLLAGRLDHQLEFATCWDVRHSSPFQNGLH